MLHELFITHYTNGTLIMNPFTRINLNYTPLSRLIMDLKVMLRSNKGCKYILCIIDEVMNYIIMVPIDQSIFRRNR